MDKTWMQQQEVVYLNLQNQMQDSNFFKSEDAQEKL